MRTYEFCSFNPFRMRTYKKTQGVSTFPVTPLTIPKRELASSRQASESLWSSKSIFAILRSGTGLYPASTWQLGNGTGGHMSALPTSGSGKITVPELLQRKSKTHKSTQQKITCLTAYDYPTARLLDEAGVEVLLVGDSLGMVVLGHDSTLPVSIEEMLHHTRAVRRGTKRALVVADMPYGSFHGDIAESVRNAVRFVKESGAEAVKVEGGERRLELIV